MTRHDDQHPPPDSWTRIQEIFSRCIDLHGEKRDARMRQLCGDDPTLLAEVRSLLERSDQSAAGLDREPAWSLARIGLGKSSIDPGARVGRYRIEAVIAEGGNGRGIPRRAA
jgi:hypothetical protein